MNLQAISDSLIPLAASRWMTRSFARSVEVEAVGVSLTPRLYGPAAIRQPRAWGGRSQNGSVVGLAGERNDFG